MNDHRQRTSSRPGYLFATLLCLVLLMGCRSSKEGTPSPIPAATAPSPGPTRLEGAPLRLPTATVTPPPPTSAPSPTWPPSPTPTPTETVDPQELPGLARQAMADGDYGRAIALWRAALEWASPEAYAAWTLELGRAYMAEERYQEAIATLAEVVTDTVAVETRTLALGLLGRSYEALGEWRAAIDAYGRYLAQELAAAPQVLQRLAKAYEALGEEKEALAQMERVDLETLPPAAQAEVLEERARFQRKLKDYDTAQATYEQILSFAKLPTYRALVLHKQGETWREAQEDDKASAAFRQVLQEQPHSYAGYLALLALDELGAADISDLERGQVLYYAGQYAAAVEALQRYESSEYQADLASAYYYLGRAYHKLGQYARAFASYDRVIEHYPDSSIVPDAWLAKAEAAAAYGSDPSGLYREFWRRYPKHPQAPEALWLAAKSLERAGEWARAAEFYRLLRHEYPNDERAPEALFREGLAAYALGDHAAAEKLWSLALEGESSVEQRTRLLVWLGLSMAKAGQATEAAGYYEKAAALAPRSYYGQRARDLRRGTPPRLSLELSYEVPQSALSPSDWQRITTWVSSWYSPTIPLTMSTSLAEHIWTRRSAALVELGWHQQAVDTLHLLRDSVRELPLQLVALARIAEELELHPVTLACAERLLWMGRESGADEAPKALWRLAYPTPYGRLVSQESARYLLDPLLYLAIIRQESRFNPYAVSYAGASGLTQVMPATGAWIATRIGPDDYREDLLERPMLNLRYGAWFLNVLLGLYDRDWIATLVAYNAGPGNLKSWTDGKPIQDHDLFYETLPVEQAQKYVRLVYEQYRTYERLYREERE